MNYEALWETVIRWAHVLSGIAWVGLLYFFNFVNAPFAKTLDAAAKKQVVPELMPRALWWFRWAAMATLLFGLLLLYWVYVRADGNLTLPAVEGVEDSGGLTSRARFIMWGMLLGVVMWFNVWFIIWPAQKRILRGIRSGDAAPANLAARAALASKTNTYLSGPMLFLMIAAPHIQNDFSYGMLGIIIVAGAAIVHVLLTISKGVGTEV